MAVEQDGVDLLVAHAAAHVGDVVGRTEIRGQRRQLRIARQPGAAPDHQLRSLVVLEQVGKVVDRRAVDRAEMRHVGDVVDQLPAVGADHHLVHGPFRPLRREARVDARNCHLRRRRAALGVVPDEQQPVLLAGLPGADTRLGRHALAVGDRLAAAVAAPLPAVERAYQVVALHGAGAQVRAHVRTVAVDHADGAGRVGERRQAPAEDVQCVRLAVAVGVGQAEAVPAARVAGLGRA
ncbi:hypothetical protein D9M72_340630 [compost metagenome]